MVNWNPAFPEVLGNEWLVNIGNSGRVWAGAPAIMARMQSTAAETITTLKMSATVNPLLEESVPTVVDIVEEGSEDIGLFKLASLIPNGDTLNEGWTTQTGATTNLFQSIDSDATRWPGPAQNEWIQTTVQGADYGASVNATSFAGGGANQNARIGWVAVQAIWAANTGFRKAYTSLDLGGTLYAPAGGWLRDVHGYGALYTFWWGELNPATGLPWTPANIANFGAAGTYRLRAGAGIATTKQFPKLHAIRLYVYHQTVENRVAVGVWRRPEAMVDKLTNVATDALITLPAGTANWAKATAKNYLFYWRQSVSPSEYGAVVADDVRWNLAYQHLGPVGQPPGIAFAPGNILATRAIAYDQYGRPAEDFPSTSTAQHIGSAAGLAMVRSDAAISVDSQPYRLVSEDLELVTTTQKLGQRVTPTSTNTYLGVRFPIWPPATGNPTLTVAVVRVSDSVQMGGTYTITAANARALPGWLGGWRYITGFLASGATLTSGISYEIRMTTSAGGDWRASMPDSSLGETASFGGSTNGGFIGATHFPTRELAVTLVRQPDAPTNPTAAITNVAVTTFSDQATTVPHVLISWTLPAVGMGAQFARYEIERQLAAGPWERIANILTSTINNFTDREAPRTIAAGYRIRAVGKDGRFSNWATSTTVTPTDPRAMLILASNHSSVLYFVHLYEITDSADAETVYPILSTSHDETVAIHGADYQVVFMEAEDRGVGWRTRVSLKQTALTTRGLARWNQLLALVRSLEVPYVCAVDHQGTRILGHVSVSEGVQTQPDYRYTAQLDITPTHTAPVPVEVT